MAKWRRADSFIYRCAPPVMTRSRERFLKLEKLKLGSKRCRFRFHRNRGVNTRCWPLSLMIKGEETRVRPRYGPKDRYLPQHRTSNSKRFCLLRTRRNTKSERLPKFSLIHHLLP